MVSATLRRHRLSVHSLYSLHGDEREEDQYAQPRISAIKSTSCAPRGKPYTEQAMEPEREYRMFRCSNASITGVWAEEVGFEPTEAIHLTRFPVVLTRPL